jgi:predicted metal-dependent hydrolase
VLFDAGLFFEVHEVLEPHWVRATGDLRETLQGAIQAAVGWQHLANGNLAGARSLLEEAAARLHGRRLHDLDVEPLARAAAEAASRLPAIGEPPRFPRPPAAAR